MPQIPTVENRANGTKYFKLGHGSRMALGTLAGLTSVVLFSSMLYNAARQKNAWVPKPIQNWATRNGESNSAESF